MSPCSSAVTTALFIGIIAMVAVSTTDAHQKRDYDFGEDDLTLEVPTSKRSKKRKVKFVNDYISHRTPLPVVDKSSEGEPVRLNILMPAYTPPFGHEVMALIYFSILASERRNLPKIRWLQFQDGSLSAEAWRDSLSGAKPSLRKKWQQLYDNVEILNVSSGVGSNSIPCNKRDQFMATVHYSAPMAWETVQKLGYRKSIIYFIQDYEPAFFPHNSQKMEAEESYSIPHFPIFSTPALMKYFQVKRIGLYSRCSSSTSSLSGSSTVSDHNDEECREWGFAFEADVKRYEFSMERFQNETSSTGNKLLGNRNGDHQRPSRIKRLAAEVKPQTPRYVYDLVVSSVGAAIRDGVFGDSPEKDWKFIGVGASTPERQCGLGGPDCSICMDIYNFGMTKKMAAKSDIALSLILTPTSLPAVEYAGAGLITVVNTGHPSAKSAELYRNISKNFVPVPLHLDDIVDGLKEAVKRVDDGHARKKHSKLNWATSWSDDRCFGKPLFTKIAKWMNDPAGPAKYESKDFPFVLSDEDFLSLGGVDPLLLNL